MSLNLLKYNTFNNFNNIQTKINATHSWNFIPDEILEKIFNLIPNYIKVLLSKSYYLNYHYLIRQFININLYESYIRSIIRDDMSFVFDSVLNENISKWIHWKNYRYKSNVYSSYLYFLYNNIEHNNATKCKQILVKKVEAFFCDSNSNKKKASINTKNWFKNNNIKNVKIEWIN